MKTATCIKRDLPKFRGSAPSLYNSTCRSTNIEV